jgi:Domain of unknown function (DUF4169)
MAEIVNLRRVRKTKAKEEKALLADVNRQKFGQSKTEKRLTKAKLDQVKMQLDGHKRDPV